MRALLLCACLLALLLAGCSESATVRAKGQWEGSVSTGGSFLSVIGLLTGGGGTLLEKGSPAPLLSPSQDFRLYRIPLLGESV